MFLGRRGCSQQKSLTGIVPACPPVASCVDVNGRDAATAESAGRGGMPLRSPVECCYFVVEDRTDVMIKSDPSSKHLSSWRRWRLLGPATLEQA